MLASFIRYNCHINVEICSSVEAVKYIHKYIYKGHDRTTLEVMDQNRNEIKEYLDAHYIGAVESCWHMFEFPMHAETPNVYRLPVHMPDEHTVYFHANDDIDEVVQRGATKVTRLTAWFEANRKYPAARTITYQDAPKAWVYKDKKKEWAPRKQGKPAISRMWFVSPSQGERFYLRMLLTVVMCNFIPGPLHSQWHTTSHIQAGLHCIGFTAG